MWSPIYLEEKMEKRLGTCKILLQKMSVIAPKAPGQTCMKICPVAVSK